MLRLLHGTNVDFIRLQKWTTIATAAFIVPGLLLIGILGFNYSIEFTGGTLVQVEFEEPATAGDIRNALAERGVEGAEIQSFGSAREFVIRAQERGHVEIQEAGAESIASDIDQGLRARYGENAYTIVRTEAVGPKVGSELRQRAALAMLLSFVVTLFYLAWRFEWRFGLAAIVATIHDFVATLAFARYMGLEISLVVVGALLTVIGYSLNDTIVIFDRIRENLKIHKKMPLRDLVNKSVNETLPRTVITGITTIGSIIALLVFAGPIIRPFAWILLFGLVVGTFSSIYVAAPILLMIERKWPHRPDSKSRMGHRPGETQQPPRAREAATAGSR